MKFFISTDIEGIAELTTFEEANQNSAKYKNFREQMTKEIRVICD